MDTVKRFLKYVVFIILFFIFSNLLINVNLQARYKTIERKDDLTQVSIYQAEATAINGHIKGTIFNDENSKIENNYLKIDLYSDRDILLGSRYIDVSNLRDNETRNFEAYFKIQNVKYYEMSFVDEKDEETELPELVKDLSKTQILWGTIIMLLIFK